MLLNKQPSEQKEYSFSTAVSHFSSMEKDSIYFVLLIFKIRKGLLFTLSL
nr:MAG TPA: hypothetical protein [Caudoviricetes sp.]